MILIAIEIRPSVEEGKVVASCMCLANGQLTKIELQASDELRAAINTTLEKYKPKDVHVHSIDNSFNIRKELNKE